MDEPLLEYADSRGLTIGVDRESGILRGVKILGLESRNGRSYPPATLTQARDLYEGAKVNVNHPKAHAAAPRDYQDRIGVLRNVVIDANAGLFADLHFNPRHALAGQLEWDASHAPENVGLSHNVLARTSRRNERVIVEAITKVLSVDLVADPASTHGLFEAERPQSATPAPFDALTIDVLRLHRPDLVEELVAAERSTVTRLEAEAAALREALGGGIAPKSREQRTVEPAAPVRDLAEFVRAIRA